MTYTGDARYPDAMTPDAKYSRALRIGVMLARVATKENDRRNTIVAEQRAAGTDVVERKGDRPQYINPEHKEQPKLTFAAGPNRTVKINFAASVEVVAPKTRSFYVGVSVATSKRLINSGWEPALVGTFVSDKRDTPIDDARKFAADLQKRIDNKHIPTVQALNRIAKAGLDTGAVTIVNDNPKSAHARIIGATLAGAIRAMGHYVTLPTPEKKQTIELTKDEGRS
jgi:hypothetical protein